MLKSMENNRSNELKTSTFLDFKKLVLAFAGIFSVTIVLHNP